MQKIKYIPLSVGMLVCLYLANIYLLIYILSLFPQILIENNMYEPAHKAILDYMLYGFPIVGILPQDQASHITDVRRLISYIPITVAITAASFIPFYKLNSQQRKNVIMLSIGVSGALSVTAAALFGPFFILFHKIFFPMGNWSFPSSSILIQLYPEKFWLICFLLLIALTTCELLVLKLVKVSKS